MLKIELVNLWPNHQQKGYAVYVRIENSDGTMEYLDHEGHWIRYRDFEVAPYAGVIPFRRAEAVVRAGGEAPMSIADQVKYLEAHGWIVYHRDSVGVRVIPDPPFCGTCRWFNRGYTPDLKVASVGGCRRYPATAHPSNNRGQFPVVEDDMWCGEHAPVPAHGP